MKQDLLYERMINILRVISGTAKSHRLKTIKGDSTRPTADKVKESLFNIIAARINGACVLDVFAGTGNLGIEALSRGASNAVFIDKSRECCNIIKENLIHTKLESKSKIICSHLPTSINNLKGYSFDIIFMDPPYKKNLIEKTMDNLLNNDIIDKSGLIIAEHHIEDVLSESIGDLIIIDKRKYGDTCLSFYSYNEARIYPQHL